MEGGSLWARMGQVPFSLWVVAGALAYSALALFVLALPFVLAGGITAGGGLALFLYLFVALFLIAAAFTLRQKRWAYVLGAAVAIALVLLFSTFIGATLSSPADSEFWLAVTVLPLMSLGIVFAILSVMNAKTGLNQKKYLATPMSSGGLLTVAVIGFVVGSLVVGAIGAGVIREGLAAGPADVSIVADSVTVGRFQPANFTVHLSAGGKVTWVDKDTSGHTVTSKTGLFDSGTFSTGRTWSYTFRAAGEYPYYCTIHPMMVRKIVVVP
jgi:plastocyanin